MKKLILPLLFGLFLVSSSACTKIKCNCEGYDPNVAGNSASWSGSVTMNNGDDSSRQHEVCTEKARDNRPGNYAWYCSVEQ